MDGKNSEYGKNVISASGFFHPSLWKKSQEGHSCYKLLVEYVIYGNF